MVVERRAHRDIVDEIWEELLGPSVGQLCRSGWGRFFQQIPRRIRLTREDQTSSENKSPESSGEHAVDQPDRAETRSRASPSVHEERQAHPWIYGLDTEAARGEESSCLACCDQTDRHPRVAPSSKGSPICHLEDESPGRTSAP